MQTLVLRQRADFFELIDARAGKNQLRQVQGQDLSGLNLDDGFAIVQDGNVYIGSDAAWLLASLGHPSNWRFRAFRALTRTPDRSRIFYPILRTARNLLLRVLGRKKINS